MAGEPRDLYVRIAQVVSESSYDIIRQDPAAASEFGKLLAVAIHQDMPDACLLSLVNGFLSVLAVQRKVWVNPKE